MYGIFTYIQLILMVNINIDGIDIPYMDPVGDGRDISMVGLGRRLIQKKRIEKKKRQTSTNTMYRPRSQMTAILEGLTHKRKGQYNKELGLLSLQKICGFFCFDFGKAVSGNHFHSKGGLITNGTSQWPHGAKAYPNHIWF